MNNSTSITIKHGLMEHTITAPLTVQELLNDPELQGMLGINPRNTDVRVNGVSSTPERLLEGGDEVVCTAAVQGKGC